MNNFSNRDATTKTRFSSGNLAINTTKLYKLQGNMEICENCKRKDKENKNIQTKELNEIIEADKINFQTGNNKIEKVKFFFAEISSCSFVRQFLLRVFGSRKYLEDIRKN